MQRNCAPHVYGRNQARAQQRTFDIGSAQQEIAGMRLSQSLKD
jgi:hypothetical protein